MQEIAKERWPVIKKIFYFDLGSYTVFAPYPSAIDAGTYCVALVIWPPAYACEDIHAPHAGPKCPLKSTGRASSAAACIYTLGN